MPATWSIIIPCKNEAANIGKLFDSILMQQNVDLGSIPIYVADADSTDGTLAIIEDYIQTRGLNITVVQGGYPAAGRNNGARHANTAYLLFMDADITLGDPHFLSKVEKKISGGDLHLITSYIRCLNGNLFDRFIWFMHAFSINVSKYHHPMAAGMFMGVRKDIFEQIGGFDEEVILGEDVELSRKIHHRKFGIVNSYIYTTNRRFKKMGYFKTIVCYTLVALSPKFRHRNNSFYFEDKEKTVHYRESLARFQKELKSILNK
jgi:glycosyltransferase involved in cell wall biosynthesis